MAVDAETIKMTSILFMVLTTFAIAIYWFINFVESDEEKTFRKRVNSFATILIHIPYAAAWFYFMFYLYCAPGIETAFIKATYKYDIVNRTDGTYIYSETNNGQLKLTNVLHKPEDYIYVIDEFDSTPKNGMIYTNFQKYKYRIERKPISPPVTQSIVEKEEEVHF